eukprot:1160252-Pelagomonas_calceolata.AAC.18
MATACTGEGFQEQAEHLQIAISDLLPTATAGHHQNCQQVASLAPTGRQCAVLPKQAVVMIAELRSCNSKQWLQDPPALF